MQERNKRWSPTFTRVDSAAVVDAVLADPSSPEEVEDPVEHPVASTANANATPTAKSNRAELDLDGALDP